jgi:hypothetical protein
LQRKSQRSQGRASGAGTPAGGPASAWSASRAHLALVALLSGLACALLAGPSLSAPAPARPDPVPGAGAATPARRLDARDFGAKGDGLADESAAFAAAAAACDAAPGSTLHFPEGTYRYTGGLSFSRPVTLEGNLGAVLDYRGDGKAVQLGPDGLDVKTFHTGPYRVLGLTFTGGERMTHGLYFNAWLASTLVRDTRFTDFGNPGAWNLYYRGHDWHNRVESITMDSSPGFARAWNGLRSDGAVTGTLLSDFGQSRTLVSRSIFQPFGAVGGTGIFLNGFHSQVVETTVSSFTTAIHLGSWANGAVLDRVYIEQHGSASPAILYGDPGGLRQGERLSGLVVRGCYANLHDRAGGSGHLLGPANPRAGLRALRLEDNTVTGLAPGEPLVVPNQVAGQTGNTASGNFWVSHEGDWSEPAALAPPQPAARQGALP